MAIKVVRIGASEPAPNFELVAKPNDWGKTVKRATATTTGEGGKRAAVFREFWEVVIPRLRAAHPTWTRRTTSQQPFLDTIMGVRGVVGSMTWTKAGLVSQIYFLAEKPAVATARFEWLLAERDLFEATLGESAVWDPMEGRGAARVYLLSSFDDIADRDRWPQMIEWLLDTQARLRRAFEACARVSDVPAG